VILSNQVQLEKMSYIARYSQCDWRNGGSGQEFDFVATISKTDLRKFFLPVSSRSTTTTISAALISTQIFLFIHFTT
jgi:hypothetical protein